MTDRTTDLKLIYTSPKDPVVVPTDVLHVKAGQSTVMLECQSCGWRSQAFQFAARKVSLTARAHFLGLSVGGKVVSWTCHRRN
jgi:hypothetical protein